jgi:hypothetical protein
MHTLHANFGSSAETHLLCIRHAVEVFLFLQHLGRHSCFRMRLSIQLMQDEPEPDLDSQVQLLRDFPQQQLPEIFVLNRPASLEVAQPFCCQISIQFVMPSTRYSESEAIVIWLQPSSCHWRHCSAAMAARRLARLLSWGYS